MCGKANLLGFFVLAEGEGSFVVGGRTPTTAIDGF